MANLIQPAYNRFPKYRYNGGVKPMSDKLDLTELNFDSLTVHAGADPDPQTGAVMVPIYQTSTYAQHEVGKFYSDYEYSRTDNPTRTALQTTLAALEGGKYALAFASGMAATDTLMRLVKPGDHVIVGNDVYGGTYRLFDKVLSQYGIKFDFIEMTDLEAVKSAVLPETKLFWLETPTNPTLKVSDISALAEIAHTSGAKVVVDNTFSSPALQRPLTLGADFVLHSTTKYIGGHSDVVGGAIIMNDDADYEQLKFLQNAIGAVPAPMDCFLTMRGIKTLALRMAKHSANGLRVAQFLADHPKVLQVIYPGLEDHPQHDIAKRQMSDFGGMVSFLVDGKLDFAKDIARKTQMFTLAESLGGVESLIEVPAPMTHASVADSALAVPENLVRISCGIENAEDLIVDLGRALG